MAERWREDAPLRVGVSACLLGQAVRWDGGHKRDAFLTEQLAPYVEWVPVCPELELGLGVPRETLRLERHGDRVALRDERSGHDRTTAMRRFAAKRVRQLRALDLCGYVLKKDSPSCGLERVRVWKENGQADRRGRGLFAEALVSAYPELPVEEEGRLRDPRLRETFVEALFAQRRLRRFFASRWTRRGLVAFHSAHKFQLLAHAPAVLPELGRLVARAAEPPRAVVRERYVRGFAAALAKPATRRRHLNVLDHAQRQLRKWLDPGSRAELGDLIDAYGAGHLPLLVPITLIRHHARLHGIDYLTAQVYFDPNPVELMLRNHV